MPKSTKSTQSTLEAVTIEFVYDRDTKRTFRFTEVDPDTQEPREDSSEDAIGTLYVKKSLAKVLGIAGDPATVTITLSMS